MKKLSTDKDLVRARVAMKEAAADARRIAFLTKTPLVIFEDGKIVKKWIRAEDLDDLPGD